MNSEVIKSRMLETYLRKGLTLRARRASRPFILSAISVGVTYGGMRAYMSSTRWLVQERGETEQHWLVCPRYPDFHQGALAPTKVVVRDACQLVSW